LFDFYLKIMLLAGGRKERGKERRRGGKEGRERKGREKE
jgi:hypothetical protein